MYYLNRFNFSDSGGLGLLNNVSQAPKLFCIQMWGTEEYLDQFSESYKIRKIETL